MNLVAGGQRSCETIGQAFRSHDYFKIAITTGGSCSCQGSAMERLIGAVSLRYPGCGVGSAEG